MSTSRARQRTETDVRFKRLLDASPMPESVRRLYESLRRQEQHIRQRVHEQQRPKGRLNASVHREAPEPNKMDMSIPTEAPVRPSHTEETSSLTGIQGSGSSTKENNAPEARGKRSNYKKLVTGSSSNQVESYPQSSTVTNAASQRRRSARSSGPREYWVLGSRRKIPIYNETALSKPHA
ncbi:hypothetical protein TWF481_011139 [Arthrobotrys musiformis]|uniref:Uncharacterized protein n=1 Tax=Arthrobotrys musiformis TaxID=47236 RepID=A0AAV9VXE6_9PEZI